MELFEHCRGCARYSRSCTGMSKEVCEQHNLRVPITKADRFRSMTDEELAEWLNNMQTDAYNRGLLEDRIIGYPKNYSTWLDWLRQEVADGETAL